METANLELDHAEAHRMFLKYKTHRHYQNPVDAEILKIYESIAKGRVIIRALESIRKAGVGSDGLPKLAIARADARDCYLTVRSDGSACMMSDLRRLLSNTQRSRYVDFPAGTFPSPSRFASNMHAAIVPHIPPDIRPRRGIQNYHVLFEAIWRREPPIDPMLLRRIGHGDMWLVVGAWELTSVERGVMADRITR